MKTRIFLSSLLAGGVVSPFLPKRPLSVDWDWKRSHECKPVSPAIKVTGIPADARSLAVSMIDHDMRSYDHGGGSVAVSGESSFHLAGRGLAELQGAMSAELQKFRP
jgi:hypothetical protein